MAHGHAHEEAEHAQHASHDPFDKRVALTMVVIAAVLAAVKLLGHRAHNEVLVEQIHAGTAHTQESDTWNLFQAQRLRFHIYNVQVVNHGGPDGDDEKEGAGGEGAKKATPEDSTDPVREKYEQKRARAAAKAEKEKEKAEKKGEEAQDHIKESIHAHHQANYLDGAELFVELGLVLCSVAILIKRNGFWYGGMAVTAVGVVLAVVSFFVH
jgi:hypothetical protein